MTVIYAEKPDLGRKIAAALCAKPTAKDKCIELEYKGEPTVVVWGFGHMYGLQDAKDYDPMYARWNLSNYPFFPTKYRIVPREGASAQLKVVNGWLKKADLIVNAADADREGELIFAYVMQGAQTQGKPVRRLWLHSYLPEAIRDAYDHMRDGSEMRSLELAARTRACIDWSVGINLTIFATKLFPNSQLARQVVSIGRVQTPTLAMLVARELEIRGFVSRPFWSVAAQFAAARGEYSGQYETEQLFDKTEAERILAAVTAAPDGVVTSIKRTAERVPPPKLFCLSTLQKEANRRYGFTAQQTLSLAQGLYESQLITYPRSSAQCLPENMKGDVRTTIGKLTGFPEFSGYAVEAFAPFTKRHFDDKAVESHFAIIPTGKRPGAIKPEQRRLYDLIALSLIRIAHPVACLEKTEVVTTVAGYRFRSSGRVVAEAGWMAVDAMPKKETVLPPLTEGEPVRGEYALKESQTEPPKRYTDATLVSAMAHAGKDVEDDDAREMLKELGIGTEATRASIIETLFTRGYAERDGKAIVPTEMGIRLIQYLPIETLKSPEMTGRMETRLHAIEVGEEPVMAVINDAKADVMAWCARLMAIENAAPAQPDEQYRCPLCGRPLVTGLSSYVRCSGSTDKEQPCAFRLVKTVCGRPLTSEQLAALLLGRTAFVSGMRSKSGKGFAAQLKLDEKGELVFEFKKRKASTRRAAEKTAPRRGKSASTASEVRTDAVGGEPQEVGEAGASQRTKAPVDALCPRCGKVLAIDDERASCECGFSLARVVCSKRLTETQVKNLCAGKGVRVKGMTSKAGRPFDALLTADRNGRIAFSFDK